jgi:DNA-binding LacI/PurR family transcriptional regulator
VERRPTIADIAREAGVSKGAVSYALNGQPGVSAATRRRILDIVERRSFRASSAARALAGGASRVVGLTLRRPARTLALEPFFMELVSGLEAELSTRSYALLLQMVADQDEEIACYRRWLAEHRVDGVLVCDVLPDDRRVSDLAALGLPAVVIGPPQASGALPSVWSDDAASLVEAVRYLAALGHRRIARVGGIAGLAHTVIRTDAFTAACAALGLAGAVTVPTDYTGEAGAAATRELLAGSPRPTALIFDNDIMAIAGLTVAQDLGLRVPADLSVVAWDDSPVCELVHPPLTALTRDIRGYGAHAARVLLAALAGEPVASQQAAPAQLTPRGSTGPAALART